MIRENNNLNINFGAVVVRKPTKGGPLWLLVREKGKKWKIPKSIVRKRESSVRAVLRTMGEQCGISCEVLEEVGRKEDYLDINGKKTPRTIIYYLVLAKNKGEILGFGESSWFNYEQALKKIGSAKERAIFKQAKTELKKRVSRQKK